jgi:hypothetical protein
MEIGDALVYIPEPDALLALHADWPEDMRAALCLRSDGDCQIAVFHAEESSDALMAMSRLIRRSASSLVVVPAHEGYATRKISFSEDQRLCGILAEAPGLGELAADYAMNYRYVREGGTARAAPDPERRRGVPPPPGHSTLRRDIPWLACRDGKQFFARIFLEADEYRLTIHDGEPPLRVGEVLRVEVVDDEPGSDRVLLKAVSYLGRGLVPGDSLVIGRAALPGEIATRWSAGDGHATLRMVQDSFVLVDYPVTRRAR